MISHLTVQSLDSGSSPIVGQAHEWPEKMTSTVLKVSLLASSGYLSSKVTVLWPAVAMKRCSAMPHLPRERERGCRRQRRESRVPGSGSVRMVEGGGLRRDWRAEGEGAEGGGAEGGS